MKEATIEPEITKRIHLNSLSSQSHLSWHLVSAVDLKQMSRAAVAPFPLASVTDWISRLPVMVSCLNALAGMRVFKVTSQEWVKCEFLTVVRLGSFHPADPRGSFARFTGPACVIRAWWCWPSGRTRCWTGGQWPATLSPPPPPQNSSVFVAGEQAGTGTKKETCCIQLLRFQTHSRFTYLSGLCRSHSRYHARTQKWKYWLRQKEPVPLEARFLITLCRKTCWIVTKIT